MLSLTRGSPQLAPARAPDDAAAASLWAVTRAVDGDTLDVTNEGAPVTLTAADAGKDDRDKYGLILRNVEVNGVDVQGPVHITNCAGGQLGAVRFVQRWH